MKGKIVAENYDDKLHLAYIEKATKYGTFEGLVHCFPEDRDIESLFTGLSFAEYKCDLQAYAAKAKELKARARGAAIVYNNLLQSVPADNEVMQKLLRQVKYLAREAKKLDNRVKYAQANYNNFAENELQSKREFNKKIKDMREKTEKAPFI